MNMQEYEVTIKFEDEDSITVRVEAVNPLFAPILAVNNISEHYMSTSPIVAIAVKLLKE